MVVKKVGSGFYYETGDEMEKLSLMKKCNFNLDRIFCNQYMGIG